MVTRLDQPLTLRNGVTIKNRLLKSAMSESLATIDNHVTPALPRLYRRWAEGGIGLLITGNVMIDRRALGEPNNVVLEDERDLPLLQEWARAGTANGTQLWMQLNHPGKQVPKGLNKESVAPSAIPFKPEMQRFFATPRALTEVEILDIIARFARSAGLAKKAGFTGVQIHGAHGYLVNQFLSGHHNQRTDRWGGALENRMRFVLEVYKAIRAEVGAGFPVSIKLNSADFQRGGFTEAESMTVIDALASAGIDLIEISGGTYEAPTMATGKQDETKASTQAREAYFLEFAEQVRDRVVDTALAVTGGFRSADGINTALASGAIDMAGLARALALDPEFPHKLQREASARSAVKPLKTGVKMVDRMGMMEVSWYSLQLHRLGAGRNPKPNEHAFLALLKVLLNSGIGTFRTRLRAS